MCALLTRAIALHPINKLPELLADPDKLVWFCEGEWTADHLAKLGVLATTTGGNTSAAKADLAPRWQAGRPTYGQTMTKAGKTRARRIAAEIPVRAKYRI
ncbi:MAG TPA: hypothetical protein VKB53_05025 [Gammaproteobacteria bacterium]|nr:hypothetical protein [Gammaproteobacteria bacterium]